MRKRRCLLLLVAILTPVLFHAQNLLDPRVWKDYFPTSPEASKMPSYIDANVSYNRGLIDISIPLFVIEAGDIKLPITLTYNHKGIKIAEVNSELGLGWDLQVEPKVIRATNGQPDREMRYKSNSPGASQDAYHKYYKVRETASDGRPDQYYYNLLGKSGSFLLRPKGTDADGWLEAMTIPYDPIKIDCDGKNNIIDIVDENGFSYRFGEGKATDKFALHPSAWKANRITAPNGIDKIEFEYGDYKIQSILGLNDIFSMIYVDSVDHQARISNYEASGINTYKILSNFNPQNPIFLNLYFEKNPGSSLGYTYQNAGDRQQSQISRISYKYGEVNFIYTNFLLTKIEVKDEKGNKVRTIELKHDKPVSTEVYHMLNKVVIKDGADKELDFYEFTYNDQQGYPKIDNNEKCINFWGYFTGSSMTYYAKEKYPVLNEIKVPVRIKTYHSNYYADRYITLPGRNMEEGASAYGTLKSITNSLGGKTTFSYGVDKYLKKTPEGTNEMVNSTGGLRINKVEYTDPLTNETIIRKFMYGPATNDKDFTESGYGIVRRNITPDSYSYKQEIQNPFGGYIGFYEMNTYTTHLSGNWTFGGDPVVYDQVTEYRVVEQNGKEVNEGKIIYNFNYPLDNNRQWKEDAMYKEYEGTNIVCDTKDTWKYGQLISKKVYDNTNKLVMQNTYTYQRLSPPPNDPMLAWVVYKEKLYIAEAQNEETFSVGGNTQPYRYYDYYIGTGSMQMISELETRYDGLTPSHKMVEYSYANAKHAFPTEIKTTYTLDRKNIVRKIKYVQDDTSTGNQEHINARNKLLEKGIIAPIIEETVVSGSSTHVNTTRYKVFGNGLALPNKIFTKRNSGSEEERDVIHEYDYYGNPLYTTRDGSYHVVYIWSYKGRNPIAVIKGKTYSEVKDALVSLGGDSDFFNKVAKKSAPTDDDINKIEGLRTKLPGSLISVFSYDEFTGNMLWVSDERQIKVYNDYNSAGQLIRKYYKDNSGNMEVIEEYEYNYRNL